MTPALLGLLMIVPGLELKVLPSNSNLAILPSNPIEALKAASDLWGARQLKLAEARIDAQKLQQLASPPANEPILRWVRETLGRPVDLHDFILFLDDVLEHKGLPTQLNIPASRARAYGILLHPQEVFRSTPRAYGQFGELPVDDPPAQLDLQPAPDHSPPSPDWTARYQQPMTDHGKIRELIQHQPKFGQAVQLLFRQLKAQGAFTWIEAGVRPRERGFLIYGSWLVSRAKSSLQLRRRIQTLHKYEKAWGLNIPIRWRHPAGFRATVEAARAMADTYGVEYATPRGARNSSHYGGRAVDIVAVNLPRRLKIEAPNGAIRVFDLSKPSNSRDLSLSPHLIQWIEQHFGMKKLAKDYPHWYVVSNH